MTLPPRIPAPEFPPDVATVPRLRAAARRRRSVQGGVLGALLTAFVMVVAGDSAGTRGLQVVEPARPTPTAAAQGTAAPGRAGPTHPEAAGPGEVPSAGPPVASPPPSPSSPPGPTEPAPGRLVRRMTVVASVVDDSGAPCLDHHTMTAVGGDTQSYDACVRWSWPATMPYGKGGDLVRDYCVVRGTLANGTFANPLVGIDSETIDSLVDRTEETTATLSAGECLRWAIRWDGIGFRRGAPDSLVYLPRGPYKVLYFDEYPTFAGETVYTDTDIPVATTPRERDLTIV